MQCQNCTNPATVHQTFIVDGQKQVTHLCQTCAEKKQVLVHQELNLPAILQSLITQQLGPVTDSLSRLTCPCCGIQYMEFRAEGRLGCPKDYEVFRVGLDPLLKRIHRATKHLGKSPRRHPAGRQRYAELIALRNQLQAAVEAEAFEEAARLRDLIRHKESTDDESG